MREKWAEYFSRILVISYLTMSGKSEVTLEDIEANNRVSSSAHERAIWLEDFDRRSAPFLEEDF